MCLSSFKCTPFMPHLQKSTYKGMQLCWNRGYNMHAFKERFAFICQTQNLYYTDRPMKSGLN